MVASGFICQPNIAIPKLNFHELSVSHQVVVISVLF